MPDGQMRRAPQLWEQRLARTTSILGVGISSSGDATAIVPPSSPPGTGGGTEPAPVAPPAGVFKKPSTPQLIGGLQGINVLWDGLNADGDLWPYDTSFVEVHMSTAGTGFTPGTATLKGRLARPGSYFVGGLTAGTTYHFRLRGADPAGNYTEASNAASGQTGLTTSSDYGTATIGTGAVSFNARTIGGVTNTVGTATPSSPLQGDIWLDTTPGTAIIHKVYNGGSWTTNAWGSASIAAGQITALQIAAGAVTAGAIAADAITGKTITGGTITGTQINGVTITGGLVSGGTVSGGLVSGGTVTGAVITSTTVAGYQVAGTYLTPTDVGSSGSTTIDGGRITSGTITGRVVQSSSGNARIVLNNADTLDFFSSGVKRGDLYGAVISGVNGIGVTGALDVSSTMSAQSLTINGANADFPGITTGATTADAGFNGDRLRKKTSSQRYKYDITPLSGTLHPDVDEAKRMDAATVDPLAILDIAVAEFSWLEEGLPTDSRDLGFIAEDVAAKFPIAASIGPDGLPIAVRDTPILAALLAVVKDQAATITDLRTRIEALEA